MTTFENKSENEGWECENNNGTSHNDMDLKGEVDNISFQNSNQTKKGRSKLKWISIILTLSIIILSSLSYLNYYYRYSYLPHKVAEEYLNAIRLHDLTKTEIMWGLSGESILANLIDWEFADRISIPSEKIEINLSEEDWKEEVAFALIAFRAYSVDSLPLPEIIINGYRDYGVWFGNQSKSYKVFQEGENYYYYTVPKVEYLFDIAGLNEMGIEFRKKYILILDKWNKGWAVTEFKAIS